MNDLPAAMQVDLGVFTSPSSAYSRTVDRSTLEGHLKARHPDFSSAVLPPPPSLQSRLRTREETYTCKPHWTHSRDLSEAIWYLNTYEIVMNLITLFNEVCEVPREWLQPCSSSQLGAAAERGGRTSEWRTVTNNEDFVRDCRASWGVDRRATLLWNGLRGRFTVCVRCLDPTNFNSSPQRDFPLKLHADMLH